MGTYIVNPHMGAHTHTHTPHARMCRFYIRLFWMVSQCHWCPKFLHLIYGRHCNPVYLGPGSSARFLLWLELSDVGGNYKGKVAGRKGGQVMIERKILRIGLPAWLSRMGGWHGLSKQHDLWKPRTEECLHNPSALDWKGWGSAPRTTVYGGLSTAMARAQNNTYFLFNLERSSSNDFFFLCLHNVLSNCIIQGFFSLPEHTWFTYGSKSQKYNTFPVIWVCVICMEIPPPQIECSLSCYRPWSL